MWLEHRSSPFKGGPEPSEKLIRKVLVPIGRFHLYFIPVPKQIWLYHPTWYISRSGWSVFRSDRSRVLRVRLLWFPTSDRLQTWLIPSGMTRSRIYHESTIVWRNLPPYHRFWYFVLSFSSKRAWQSGSRKYQRWYEGRLRQNMVDSWHCLDRSVPERMSQVSRRSEVGNHTIAHCFKMGSPVKWKFCALFDTMSIVKLFHSFEYRKIPPNDSS